MFCLRKGTKSSKDYRVATSGSVNSLDGLTDNNASFLRAARAGNLEKVLEYLKGNIDINTSNANGLNALHLASKEGHVNVVTELLKRGANVNAATKKGNTALHIASLAGQYEVVKVLVNLGANVNVQSQNGFTPLYMAAQENHDNVVSFLLANGANQSLATEDGFTPLAVALQQGHDKVVAVLLENDTKGKVRLPALHIAAKKDDCKAATLLLQNDHNADVTSKSGFTPLHIAAHYGNENIANILLDKGADVNYAAKHQITPLHVASKWGKSNMVILLVDKGANIEASTRDGLTPLHCAARSGHDQVVDQLLERGAPILAKTKNGLAPLHMASQGDHVDSARILLYHKAPVDDVTVDYLTALHVAAHCGHVKVAKLLLDRKADPNARALNGFTPLHIACKKNRIKVVELLLKHGASIEATTESGLTPLHVASFMGCMNIVIHLIQNGANPDVPTVRGETPLHLAARANQTDIIRILLRNGADVDARAREEQTPLHIAARLGNVDIVSLLLQHGAAVDATTKDMYTALHIAAKEDQEEVASVLLDQGASLTSTTKKGFTPLHLAAKYGNIKVARLLLQKDAPVDAQGKNGVTPLHVASHYDHVNVALLLLDKGASPHAMAKNGYTPLHIAAKKNQMDIATTLLEYGAKANSESKAGFTPLHLASQDGHTDMTTLLIEHQADVNYKANNGLTPLHLCAQEDRVNVATVLVKNGAEIGPQTKAGYTPLHVASHFGQINMVRFLLQQNADVHMTTSHGYTPLHQAAQQGHTLVVNLLLENQASPNVTTSQGQTALSIAQRLGYISVVETLKVVTETTVTTTTTTVTEEKYKVVAPETMQETFMTDSEDEGGEDVMLGDQSYRYLTADEMKSLGDDSLPIDVTKDEKQHEAIHHVKESPAPMVEEDHISPQHITPVEVGFSEKYSPDNVDLSRAPVHAGFLVSFMVDARGGAMRGCRHSGVRVIIPPRKASMPMRITCRYLRKEKLIHPPPLMEGEACASRILEVGPVGARFLGPVIIEVPHFASLRGREREITILRSDTGETWREHTLEASEEAVQEVLNESFEGDELSALEDLNTNRITRILTTDFPQYFAIVTRIRQEVHGVGPEGGMVSSTVVPQVQAVFPEGALTKKIRVGLQAQPIAPELVAKLLGNRVAVSPIVTVEPRRRKFHKAITLTIPVPQAATKGMINQYSGDAPTLRLLCSITGSTKSGGSSKAQWEDVTGSTPLQFVSDCVSFTTTVSARFWLMDCRQVNEASKFATELYQEAVHVPFMSKFVIFAKRNEPNEAHLRVFCMTDDKEDKTLETQENFSEIAKSRDVEVLEGKLQYLEFAGNLVPVTKSGEQLKLAFQAFHENRLAFTIRVKDPHVEPMGRIAFMKEPKVGRGEPPQVPICNLNVALPEVVAGDSVPVALELVTLEKSDDFIQESGLSKPESIHRADLRLSDIARELDKDWVALAQQLEISESDINVAKSEFPEDISEQALTMLRLWLQKAGSRATGNELEKGLRKISREDIIKKCMFNVELVTDDVEKAVAKVHLDQSGFDVFKEELGSSREASIRRGASLDISYDEQDIMKDAESAAETSSETGSIFERDQISQVFSDEKDRFIEEARIRRVSKTPPPSPAEFIMKEFIEEKSSAEEKILVENEALEKDAIKEEPPTTPPKPTETVDEMMKPMIEAPEVAAKQTESETWPSGEMDTSQVSVSSLPDDEKSETTTATVSSATAADAETETKVVETKDIPDSHTHVAVEDYPGILTSKEDKLVLVTEATVITDKRSAADASDSQKEGKKLVPKLRHCDAVDAKVEEWTETDDSGSIKHMIQKTTHMTLSMQQKSDDMPEGDPTKEVISESGVLEESDLSSVGPPPEAKSSKRIEIIGDEAEGVTYHQSNDAVNQNLEQNKNQDRDSLEMNATEPKKESCQDLQGASSDLTYLSPVNNSKSQLTVHHFVNDESLEDHTPSGVAGNSQESDYCFNEINVCDLLSDNVGNQKVESFTSDVEQQINDDRIFPSETLPDAHSAERDFQSDPTDNKITVDEFFINDPVPAGQSKDPVAQYKMEDSPFGVTGICSSLKQATGADKESELQYTIETPEDFDAEPCNMHAERGELCAKLEYESNLEDLKFNKTGNINTPTEGSMFITELDPMTDLEDLKTGEMSEIDIPEQGSFMEFGQQFSAVDEMGKISVLEQKTRPMPEFGYQSGFKDHGQNEIYKTDILGPGTVDITEVEGPAGKETCEMDFPERELEILCATEEPEYSELDESNSPDFENRLIPELRDQQFRMTENRKTGVPDFGNESPTDLEWQYKQEVAESVHPNSHQEQKCDETSKASITEERGTFPEKSVFQNTYVTVESEKTSEVMCEPQTELITKPDDEHISQNIKFSTMEINTQCPKLAKNLDEKLSEIIAHSGTAASSGISKYVISTDVKPGEQPDIAGKEFELLNYSSDSNLFDAPAVGECPPMSIRNLSNISEVSSLQKKTEMDQNKSDFEQLHHKHFENVVQNLREAENFTIHDINPTEHMHMLECNEPIFYPEPCEPSYSYTETENWGEKPEYDTIQVNDFEKILGSEDSAKTSDIQNIYAGIQSENLALLHPSGATTEQFTESVEPDVASSSLLIQNESDDSSSSEIKSCEFSSTTAQQEKSYSESPETLYVSGLKGDHEHVSFTTDQQQQLKYVPLTPPTLHNSQVVEVTGRIANVVQHEENRDNDIRFSEDLVLADSCFEPNIVAEGETSESQTSETIVDSKPDSVTTRIVTTTTALHHVPEDGKAFSSPVIVAGESSGSCQGAQDDPYHITSEHHSSHTGDL